MEFSGLILASSSPRRQELLSLLGLSLRIIPGEVDEILRKGEPPEEYVRRLAITKARQVAEKFPELWVLAADTIVVIDGEILGKPKDAEEAESMLKKLSGQEHRVITCYCLLQIHGGEKRERVVSSLVKFKRLSAEEIHWYINTGEPFDKAGGYAAQGKGAFMIKEIKGSYTNVVGLPLCEVIEDLQDLGVINFGKNVAHRRKFKKGSRENRSCRPEGRKKT
ncbi:MAG: Maf family protein [Thermodesulfobacteriota bacterium]